MDVWRRLDELVERADGIGALHSHRVHLYAAWRWRQLGRPLDPELVELERGALVQRLSTPRVVRLLRDAYDGPLLLLKGADVAARYPRPELRPSLDVDLLALDPVAAHRALKAGGFRECEETVETHHHLPTLEAPGLVTRIDVHGTPSWPTWLAPPAARELFDVSSQESVLGHGILTPPAAHHALLVLAHMWREVPMTRLGQLLDVWLLAAESDVDELAALARRWGIDRLWRSTDSTARAVFQGERVTTRRARKWAARLRSMRERTVLESKLAQLTAPYSGLPPVAAVRASAGLLLSDVRPEQGETWREKLRRSLGGLGQSFRPRAERDRVLEAQSRSDPPTD